MLLENVELFYEVEYKWLPSEKFTIMELNNVEIEETYNSINIIKSEIYSYDGLIADFVETGRSVMLRIENMSPITVKIKEATEKSGSVSMEMEVIEYKLLKKDKELDMEKMVNDAVDRLGKYMYASSGIGIE